MIEQNSGKGMPKYLLFCVDQSQAEIAVMSDHACPQSAKG